MRAPRLRPICHRRLFSSSPAPLSFPSPPCASTFPRLSIAPMVDVTDVHFRVLVRLLSSSAHLYTPMIPDLAAVARPHLLHSHPPTPPLHLQLAGSSLSTLLLATSLLPSPSPYASINANAGCPAPSAQAGHWGAALMLDPTYPTTLAHLHSASPLPLTLKCRIGVGPTPPHYPTFSAFIHRMRREAGVRHFIVHCRPALLHLSPALNRSVPQLDYSFAERVKEELGDEAWVEVNGGVDCEAKVQRWIASRLDGVMIGRWAYQAVFDMRHVDRWTRQWTIERRRRQRGRTEHSTERGAEVGRGEAEGEGEGEERLEADDASPPADAVSL